MAKQKRLKLSRRQREAYSFIAPYEKEKGYGPSVQEVASILGVTQGSAGHVIQALIHKKYLTRTPGVNRSLRVA
jgi:SOS-response transcriptional repressor LexA